MKNQEAQSTMNPDQAVDFVFNIVREVKTRMILNGFGEPEDILMACNKLSLRLKMDLETIIEIFGLVCNEPKKN